MRTSSRLACCTVLVVGVAGSSAAQQVVRGSVLDSATETPIAGAVVTLTGANGSSVGRTVTASSGEFSVAVSGAAVRARVLRIGFRPRDVDVASTVAANQLIRVRMSRLPSLLDAMRVTGAELCPSSTERGGAFTLWEQVRAGLLATIVARESNPAIATTLTYQRRESPSDHLVEQQVVAVRSGTTRRPFVAAASATQFAVTGYVATDTSGRTLFAPDADVLLDESFAATHCFHLERADKGHEGQIGLAFSPAPRREKNVDVDGVIWVDAIRPTLRSLDFHHTGFDDAWSRTPPGGHIEFHDAPNGVSFIERWFIDIPIVHVVPGASGSFSTGRVAPSQPDKTVVEGVHVTGGSVVSARWRDGSSWAEEPTGVSGVVVEEDSNRPIGGVLVSLGGTADTVVTDSLGRFSFAAMVPGKYRLQVADTTLEAFATSRRDWRVVDVVVGQMADVRQTLPPIGTTIAHVCRNSGSVFRAVVVGQMLGQDSTTVSNGSVRAWWRVNVGGQSFELTREDRVDARGRFLICGVPNDVVVRLQWSSGSAQADTALMLNRKAVGSLEWHVPARSGKASPPL
jgi:Carboxypeptidase regulatory-like domain